MAEPNTIAATWQKSLGNFLSEKAAATPDSVFIEFEKSKLTYRAFLHNVLKTAALYQSLGVERGDRVCLILPNDPEILFSWFGLSVIGAIAVPINTAYKRDELAFILRDSRARLLVAHGDFVETASAAVSMSPDITTKLIVHTIPETCRMIGSILSRRSHEPNR